MAREPCAAGRVRGSGGHWRCTTGVVVSALGVGLGQLAVVFRVERQDRHDQPDQPATVNTSAMPRAGPVPNQPPIASAPAPIGHERDDDELRQRSDQEGRQRRGRLLDRLGKAEDAALPLVAAPPSAASCARPPRHRARAASRRSSRPPAARYEGWMVKTQHTDQVMRLTSSSVRSGFLPSPVLRDDDAADDEGGRQDAEQSGPRPAPTPATGHRRRAAP